MPEVHQGGCLCGTVRYRTIGRPERTTICHCTFCQRLTGSAFLVEPVFSTRNVQIERSRVATYDHRSAAHGRALRVHFCPTCGAHLSLLFERFPGFQGICGGTYDDPHWFKPDRHIFIETAAPWMVFAHGAPCFAQHAIQEDGTPATPWQRAAA
ncbi:MAG TPA: GFA family protein [Burkholderiaceae bacterium]